jgi:hypothetical protein
MCAPAQQHHRQDGIKIVGKGDVLQASHVCVCTHAQQRSRQCWQEWLQHYQPSDSLIKGTAL